LLLLAGQLAVKATQAARGNSHVCHARSYVTPSFRGRLGLSD
jgi:hypothetical protein